MNVRLEQRHADFPHSIQDVLLADAAVAAEVFENVLELIR
jgi:hypothetical protein